MKKILFALFAILATAVQSNAQTSTIATLSHEGNITAYYGSNALIQAYEASADGDVISLSPGMFNAVDIKKAITVRGNGFDNDPVTGRQATYLTGSFTLSTPESSELPIVLEGIHHNSDLKYNGSNLKVQIIKSRLKNLTYSGYDKERQINIINSRIIGSFYGYNVTATCINSIIEDPSYFSESSIDFKNCYIRLNHSLSNCIFNNCIIYSPNSYLNSSDVVNNCIGGGSASVFKNAVGSNNTYIQDLSSIFESYSQEVNDEATYRLTSDAAEQYIGNDGTQIGIYGGMLPFSAAPSTPQITKFKVAEKSTADGKLSIDISISMPQ